MIWLEVWMVGGEVDGEMMGIESGVARPDSGFGSCCGASPAESWFAPSSNEISGGGLIRRGASGGDG